ncbi:N-acyl-D-glucosamine 2-epimerase [Paenibacillus puerhi]|uniref:N-acyl-D-glucosamine 2-epimerase n=1 Tax=Paenibacillus puerhi TaxID=2692622 RepID=UPI001357BFCF|nr:N-acyl-D-glucosamine 2-epimerase [Paenibacillus puerhi]
MNKQFLGKATIQIDPSFAYYTERSPGSVAAELAAAGYEAVRVFVTDETRINSALVQALREQGLQVWAMVLGNGAYSSAHLPSGWGQWQMELIKPVHDGYIRLSPFHPGYNAWKKKALARLVREAPFTGVEVAECYFPEWNGLSTGVYGDIGPQAQAAFRKFGGGRLPEFREVRSPLYYKKDPERYALWIECRVDAVNRFVDELINGAGGVRETQSDIDVATWSVAVDAGREAVMGVRELQGMDAVSLIRQVRPDAHVLQTHWPDWMRPRLPADYARRYEAFAAPLREAFPSVSLGIQTDIGSLRRMRRNSAWVKRFAAETHKLGYGFWTAYEYSIGLWMYEDPPVPLEAFRTGPNQLRVAFNKRIDSNSARSAAYRISTEMPATGMDASGSGGMPRAAISRLLHRQPSLEQEHLSADIEVDGQFLLLRAASLPAGSFVLHISGVTDTPDRWLLKGMPGHGTSPGCQIRIPGCFE